MCLKCAPPKPSKKTMTHCVMARGGVKPPDESGGSTAEKKRLPSVWEKSQADVAWGEVASRNQGAGDLSGCRLKVAAGSQLGPCHLSLQGWHGWNIARTFPPGESSGHSSERKPPSEFSSADAKRASGQRPQLGAAFLTAASCIASTVPLQLRPPLPCVHLPQ